jgi:hypothetical protein
MKKILLSVVAAISFVTATQAQTVPNYVPTNGLVGWWPFNGNANDESGNGNNGTVNGATLTTDRFGNTGKAYSFDGTNNYISLQNAFFNGSTNVSSYTFSGWFNANLIPLSNTDMTISSKEGFWRTTGIKLYSDAKLYQGGSQPSPQGYWSIGSTNTIQSNTWVFFCFTFNNGDMFAYINGILVSTYSNPYISLDFSYVAAGNSTATNLIGAHGAASGYNSFWNGKIDDIAYWNRALTQQEVTNLYNSANCNNNLAITPQNNNVSIGSAATFNATTSDASPSFVWQSDFGQGFVTLNNYGNYSGVNTNTLSIANVQLANHNQPIRAISTSGNCVDTSDIAYIRIADTCVNTVTDTNYVNQTIYDTTYITVTDTNYVSVYDTVTTYISVTDTLFIDINTVGLNNNTIINTIKVFPNPANSFLNLDYGNYINLNGYSVKIVNALSQVIYNQPITQQSETIDLSTFGGNGIYYLNILNPQGNVVEVRKIVLQ